MPLEGVEMTISRGNPPGGADDEPPRRRAAGKLPELVNRRFGAAGLLELVDAAIEGVEDFGAGEDGQESVTVHEIEQ
jgi:hypothetical protein